MPSDEQDAGTLRGHIDAVSPRLIEGWAQSVDHPEASVCLDVYAGGELIGRTLANRYREDLQAAGLGSGRHAFTFELPINSSFKPAAIGSGVNRWRAAASIGFCVADDVGVLKLKMPDKRVQNGDRLRVRKWRDARLLHDGLHVPDTFQFGLPDGELSDLA